MRRLLFAKSLNTSMIMGTDLGKQDAPTAY